MKTFTTNAAAFNSILASLLLDQGFTEERVNALYKKCNGLILDLIGDIANHDNHLTREELGNYGIALLDIVNQPSLIRIHVPECIQGHPRDLMLQLTQDIGITPPPSANLTATLADCFVNLVFANAR